MEDIIEAFGIDARLIIIQIVNFAILAGALVYFLYKPILNLLKEREEKITQGLRDAEEAAQAKTQADIEKQVILTDAHKEAEAVGMRAKESAKLKESEIVSEAEAKAVSILKEAEIKAEQARRDALKSSEKEVAQMAILASEKILRERSS